MRRFLLAFTAALLCLVASASDSQAGPILRALRADRERSVTINRTFNSGRAFGGCANGNCARSASTTTTTSSTTTTTKSTSSSSTNMPPAKPEPKEKKKS